MDKKENKAKSKIGIIIVVCTMIVVIVFSFLIGRALQANPQEIQIANVFADVDGNGTIDFIKNATVVLNAGQSNFP